MTEQLHIGDIVRVSRCAGREFAAPQSVRLLEYVGEGFYWASLLQPARKRVLVRGSWVLEIVERGNA